MYCVAWAPQSRGYVGAGFQLGLQYHMLAWLPKEVLRGVVSLWMRGIDDLGPPDNKQVRDDDDDSQQPNGLPPTLLAEDLLANLREAKTQGAEGLLLDIQNVLRTAWPFDLRGVGGRVRFWIRTADVETPIRMSRWIAVRIRNAKVCAMEGEIHSSMTLKQKELVLRQLLEMG